MSRITRFHYAHNVSRNKRVKLIFAMILVKLRIVVLRYLWVFMGLENMLNAIIQTWLFSSPG